MSGLGLGLGLDDRSIAIDGTDRFNPGPSGVNGKKSQRGGVGVHIFTRSIDPRCRAIDPVGRRARRPTDRVGERHTATDRTDGRARARW